MAISTIDEAGLGIQAYGNRNLIINGAMQVAQRGTSATGVTSDGYRTCDRFRCAIGTLGTWTISQDTSAPDDFSSSFKLLCTTADASPSTNDYLVVQQRIEAQSLQHLSFGTSSAKKLTLSFWVKSNKTGAASIEFINFDNSDKSAYPSYTINTADTWEYKTITVSGDTSGGPDNNNGAGLEVAFWLNGGSAFTGGSHTTSFGTFTSSNRNASNLGVGGAVNDYWQITGVQLEVGDTATPFEHIPFSDQLARCQRYYQKPSGRQLQGVMESTTIAQAQIPFLTAMRAAPTLTRLANSTWGSTGGDLTNTASYNFSGTGKQGAAIALSFTSSSSIGIPVTCVTDAILDLDAEL
jgi:hypothetical protein